MLNESPMPHQIIEYSENLKQRVDVDALVKHMHQAAADVDALPLAGLRTRAFAAQQYAIADQHTDNAYIAVYLRIGAGRSPELRRQIGETLFECLCAFVDAASADLPLALSYEVQQIDTQMRWNRNNLREHLVRRISTEDKTEDKGIDNE